jgi:CMP-N,N'-diacetyllegionaminic acid synthase
MADGLLVLGLVPARSGSKGIPGKNMRPFLGRPLVMRAVEAGLASGALDRVVVSTDEESIADVARAAGAEVPFLRPAALADDDTPTAPVVSHALAVLRDDDGWVPDLVAILEPTSPGRLPEHVRGAIDLLGSTGADSVATVSEVPHHYAPTKQLDLAAGGAIAGVDGTAVRDLVHRRQDLRQAYAFDGIVFACRASLVLADPPTIWGDRVLGYRVDPLYAVDLDRPEDWAPAEAKLAEVLA